MTLVTATLLSIGTITAGVEFTIDPEASSVNVELCVIGVCDSGGSPLDGFLTLGFDCPHEPTQAAIEGFHIALTDDVSLFLDYENGGTITGNARGVSVDYAGFGEPFVDLVDGTYSFEDVPFQLNGMVDYQATGLVCIALLSFGYPCQDSIDLSTLGANTATLAGSIQVASDSIALITELDITQPIDEEQPDLGVVHLFGTINASAPLPASADVNKFKAKCKRGTIKVVLVMTDAGHDGETMIVSVDDQNYSETINGKKAKLKIKDQTGLKTVTLLQPENCEAPTEVDCG